MLVTFALVLPVLLGMAAIVVDIGNVYGQKRSLQKASDAASLAAAHGLNADGTPCAGACVTNVRTVAESYLNKNGIPITLHACVGASDTNCYVTPYKSDNRVVQVRLRQDVSTLFAGIVGFSALHPSAAAAARLQVITQISPGVYDRIYNANEPPAGNSGCGFPGIEFNNEVVNAPFTSRGNVCLRGSAPGGQLLAGGVNGRIDIEGFLGLFTSANRIAAIQGGTTPIATAQIGLGCRIGTVTTNPCTTAQRVYANTTGSSPQNLTRETFGWQAEYDKAAAGPKHACNASLLNAGESAGTPPIFDNNSTYNASLGAVDITPAASYICRALDAAGNIGELSWNSITKKLTVAGVIFFDSTRFNATASSTISAPIHYYGKATIFVASNTQGLFNEKWCAGGTLGADCAANPVTTTMPQWNPSQNALWIVLGGGATGATVGNGNSDLDFKAPSAFQGAIYTVNTCHIHGAGAYLSGPLICGYINTAGLGGSALQFPPVTLYEGGTSTTTVVGTSLDE